MSAQPFGGHLKWHDPRYKRHVAELKRRGITVDEAIERGYDPLTSEETYKAIRQDVGETIAITCLKPDGTPQKERRYRLLDPKPDGRGKVQRYTQRAGTGSIIHVRRPAGAPKKRRIITEGEIKADEAAALLGAEAVSVPGVDSFLKNGELHPDLAALPWKGVVAELCYDTDQNGKPQVRRPLLEIGDRLHALGAVVKFREIYSVPNIKKTGIDDFVRHYGAKAYEKAPLHDFEGDHVRGWREELAKSPEVAGLPQFDLRPVPADWLERRLPEPDYLVEGYLTRGIVALLVAVGGAGKTNLTLQLAVAVAGGEPFFWLKTEACRVAYVGLEDPPEVLRRRVHRIHGDRLAEIRRTNELGREKRYEESIRKNLSVLSLVGQQLHLITTDRGGVVTQAPALDDLIGRLKADGIGFLVLDPMSRLHGADENSNAIGTALVNAAERIAREVGCTVLINHHTGKANAQSQNETAYAARGASGISDAARCVLVLRAIDQKEGERIRNADQLAVARGDIMRLVHAKANYSRKMDDLWLRRGEAGGFTTFLPELKDAADDYSEFKRALRSWALGHPGTFSQREVTEDSREIIFGKRVSRAAARAFFKQAVADGMLQVSGTQKGGGEAYTFAAEGPDGA